MWRLISIFVLVALASVALGQQRSRVILSERELEKAKADDATKAALQRKIPSMSFTDVRLMDAIDFLRDVSGANIHVNWRALDKAGIDRDTPLNIHVKDVSLAKALNMIMRDSSTDSAELAWALDEGVIEISTADMIHEVTRIVFYDLRDLVDPKDEDMAKELVELLVETIAPSSWVQNGGRNTVRYFDNKLVIQQTEENHESIAKLLNVLKDFRKSGENTARHPASGGAAAKN